MGWTGSLVVETISAESVLLLQEESDFKGYREGIVMDERRKLFV